MKKNRKFYLSAFTFVFLVFFFLIYSVFIKSDRSVITAINPDPRYNFIEINPEFKIYLSNLTDRKKNTTQLLIYPKSDFKAEWKEDYLSLNFENLEPDKLYIVEFYSEGSLIDIINFRTKKVDDLTEGELTGIKESYQEKNPLDELYKDVPWLKNLPIIKSTYIIVYDFEKQSIRARIIGGSKLKEAELSSIKNQISLELEALQVPSAITVDFILD